MGSLQGGRLIFEGIYHFIFVYYQFRDRQRTCYIFLQLLRLWIIDNIKTFRLVHKGRQQFFTPITCSINRPFNTDRLVFGGILVRIFK